MIRNLTPHRIDVIGENGDIIASYVPEPTSARAEQITTPTDDDVEGVVLCETAFGAPVNLPAPAQGCYLIVSLPVVQAAHLAGRPTSDLLIAAEPVRDDAGRIAGCRALARVNLEQAA